MSRRLGQQNAWSMQRESRYISRRRTDRGMPFAFLMMSVRMPRFQSLRALPAAGASKLKVRCWGNWR